MQQIIYLLYIVERVVEIETQLGNLAQLEAHLLRQLVTYLARRRIDRLDGGLSEGNTLKYTLAILRSGLMRTMLTDTIVPWVLRVCAKKISLSSFCSRRLILFCRVVSI